MSENLDLVASIWCEEWERGEFGHTAEWAQPEIEFVVADGPEPGRWFGLAGAEEGGGAILSPFEGRAHRGGGVTRTRCARASLCSCTTVHAAGQADCRSSRCT